MTTTVGPRCAMGAVVGGVGHRVERMPSALELFGFGSEDEPPSPA